MEFIKRNNHTLGVFWNRVLFIMLTACFCTALLSPAMSQSNKDSVNVFLQKMHSAYKDTRYLSFHVKYLYANGGKLDRQIDSLAGDISMDNGRLKYDIDGTETLVNDQYAVHIVRENKVIYLSRPERGDPVDLVAMLDSMLAHIKGASAQFSGVNGRQILTVHYPPNQQFKNVRLVMNSRTGWLDRMEYDLYTKGFVEADQISAQGHSREYDAEGRVTVLFSNYRTGYIDDSVFNERKYFTRDGGQFKGIGSYQDYQIFLASSNL